MIVWLASYPRSGNTFLRILLNSVFGIKTFSLYNDRRDIASDEDTSEMVGHANLPEGFQLEEARRSKDVFFIKSHEFADTSDDRVVYLIRDGRECSVSYYNYLKEYVDPAITLQKTILGVVPFGSWSSHVGKFNPKTRPNTLIIKFEGLTADPASYYQPISEFLDLQKTSDSLPTFDQLREMNPKFFRSGRVDTWQEVLTDEDVLTFWLLNFRIMNEFYPEAPLPSALSGFGEFAKVSKAYRDAADLLLEFSTRSSLAESKFEFTANKLKKTSALVGAANSLFSINGKLHIHKKIAAYKILRKETERLRIRASE